jgi:hypothetical protein
VEAEPEIEDGIAIMSSELMLMAEAPAISGSGTQASPYLITTEEELTAIALGTLSNALSSHYQLQNDIALTAETWAPITPFTGVFDGNGYEISGFKLTQSGVFGTNNGVIKNLGVSVTVTNSSSNTGGLAAVNKGTIDDCYSGGTISASANSIYVGGLVGQNTGTITNSNT